MVFKRIFGHDAKVVIKWGVKSCLDLELEGSPILDPENWSVSESWSLLHLEQAIAYIHVDSCFTISTQSQLLVAHCRHLSHCSALKWWPVMCLTPAYFTPDSTSPAVEACDCSRLISFHSSALVCAVHFWPSFWSIESVQHLGKVGMWVVQCV